MRRGSPTANEKEQIRSYPTPSLVDVLIWEYRDSTLPKNKNPEYEVTTPTQGDWPNHKLVYITPANEDGLEKWWYVADRANQDDYNWEIGPGEQLFRTYVIPRGTYLQRPDDTDSSDVVEDEFLFPPAGSASPDVLFTHYCFADDTVVEAPEELRSTYIVIRRRFLRPLTVDIRWDENFERYLRITKEIIPRTEETPAIESDGTRVEIQDGNFFHSIKITTEIELGESTYPYQIKSIPGVQNVNFPPKLDSVELLWAYAFAEAAGAAPSYSEQYFHQFNLIDARPGPYSAIVERWITDDPEAFQAANPLDTIPNPLRESIGISSYWWYAGIYGNKTQAVAKEIVLPSSIHDDIEIPLNNTAITAAPDGAGRGRTENLPATPGYDAFVALNTFKLDYRVRQLPLGLFEVSLVIIDITDLYPPPPPL
jgi:hypothetical protein